MSGLKILQACFQKTGASVVAIRKYIIHKYPSLDLERRGYLLKQALKRELNRGVIKQVLDHCRKREYFMYRNNSYVSPSFVKSKLYG